MALGGCEYKLQRDHKQKLVKNSAVNNPICAIWLPNVTQHEWFHLPQVWG